MRVDDGGVPVIVFRLFGGGDAGFHILHPHDGEEGHHLLFLHEMMIRAGFGEQQLGAGRYAGASHSG